MLIAIQQNIWKEREIERKRLAILTARYLQWAMKQRRNNDVLGIGQCVITSSLWSVVCVQLLNLYISCIIFNKVPYWQNKMFREFVLVVHTVTGFSCGCSCSCRSAKEMVKLLPQYSWACSPLFQYSWNEQPTVSVFVKWISHSSSIREVSSLLFQYPWISHSSSIREVSSLLFQYPWSEYPTLLVFVKWAAYCFSIREVNIPLF